MCRAPESLETGDAIVEINGSKVDNAAHANALLRSCAQQGDVSLLVERRGSRPSAR